MVLRRWLQRRRRRLTDAGPRLADLCGEQLRRQRYACAERLPRERHHVLHRDPVHGREHDLQRRRAAFRSRAMPRRTGGCTSPATPTASHRLSFTTSWGTGNLLDQANPAVQSWFQNYVHSNYDQFDGLMMDDTSASQAEQFYGSGFSTEPGADRATRRDVRARADGGGDDAFERFVVHAGRQRVEREPVDDPRVRVAEQRRRDRPDRRGRPDRQRHDHELLLDAAGRHELHRPHRQRLPGAAVLRPQRLVAGPPDPGRDGAAGLQPRAHRQLVRSGAEQRRPAGLARTGHLPHRARPDNDHAGRLGLPGRQRATLHLRRPQRPPGRTGRVPPRVPRLL